MAAHVCSKFTYFHAKISKKLEKNQNFKKIQIFTKLGPGGLKIGGILIFKHFVRFWPKKPQKTYFLMFYFTVTL